MRIRDIYRTLRHWGAKPEIAEIICAANTLAMQKSTHICEVLIERKRQDEIWGEQNHSPEKWITILGEEFGEACRAAYENNMVEYRAELVHVAAVAVSMMESFDRQEAKKCASD